MMISEVGAWKELGKFAGGWMGGFRVGSYWKGVWVVVALEGVGCELLLP